MQGDLHTINLYISTPLQFLTPILFHFKLNTFLILFYISKTILLNNFNKYLTNQLETMYTFLFRTVFLKKLL